MSAGRASASDDSAAQGELRTLARGGLGGLLASVVSSLGGLAFITIAAWGFPQAEVGIVFTVTSLFLIALAVVTLGSDIGIVRFLAIKVSERKPTEVGAVMSATLLPVLVLAVLAATAFWFLLPLTPLSDDFLSAARALALFLPFASVSNLVLAGTRGLGAVRPTVLVESLLRQGLQPVLAGIAALTTDEPIWLALAWVVPYSLSAVVGVGAFRRQCRRAGVSAWASPRSAAVRRVRREVWSFNAPRALTQMAQIGIRRADIPLVMALAGPAAAAVYTAASRFVAAGLQTIKGIQQMVGPQLARLVAAGDHPQAAAMLRTATTWNVLIAWPVYLTCAVLPSVVLLLFGPGYASGWPVVVILALGMLVGTAAGPVDIALLMLGRSLQSLRNNMAALVTNLILNVLLIPPLGITGAALAWSASIVVSNALPTWQIRPVLGSPTDRATALAACLAVVSWAMPPLLARAWGVEHPAGLVGASFVGGLLYLALLYRFRRPLHVAELVSVAAGRRGRRRLTPSEA